MMMIVVVMVVVVVDCSEGRGDGLYCFFLDCCRWFQAFDVDECCIDLILGIATSMGRRREVLEIWGLDELLNSISPDGWFLR